MADPKKIDTKVAAGTAGAAAVALVGSLVYFATRTPAPPIHIAPPSPRVRIVQPAPNPHGCATGYEWCDAMQRCVQVLSTGEAMCPPIGEPGLQQPPPPRRRPSQPPVVPPVTVTVPDFCDITIAFSITDFPPDPSCVPAIMAGPGCRPDGRLWRTHARIDVNGRSYYAPLDQTRDRQSVTFKDVPYWSGCATMPPVSYAMEDVYGFAPPLYSGQVTATQ